MTIKASPGNTLPMKEPDVTYSVRMKGFISERWTNWFGNMTIIREDGASTDGLATTVSIAVADQAALLGTLQKLHNLGYSLMEVRLLVDDSIDQGSE